MAQPADEDALKIQTENLINNEDIDPFKKLINSVLRPSKKQKKKDKPNADKNLFDYFEKNYPNYMVMKIVIVLALWQDNNANSPPKDKLMYLNLLNSVLTKLDEQPSPTLIHGHLVEIKPILITILVKEAFTVTFKDLSRAISLIASQIFQFKNRNKKWTSFLEYICVALEDGSKLKMGLMLLRDFPLNVGKSWFIDYVDKIKPLILNHLGDSEGKECWVLAFGALVNMGLQLSGTFRKEVAEEILIILIETVNTFLKNGKGHFVKIVFDDLLVFLKREGWRYRLDHFLFLSKFFEEITKMDRLVEETRDAVVSVQKEVESRGAKLIEKSESELLNVVGLVSSLAFGKNDSASASASATASASASASGSSPGPE